MQLIFEGAQLFLQTYGKYQIGRICRANVQGNDEVVPNPKELKNTERSQLNEASAGTDKGMIRRVNICR